MASVNGQMDNYKPKVMVFAGAGASAALDMPTTPMFVTVLKNKGWDNLDNCLNIYRRYCKQNERPINRDIDIEELRDWFISLKYMSGYADELLKSPPSPKIANSSFSTSSVLEKLIKELDSLIRDTYRVYIQPHKVQHHYGPFINILIKKGINFLPFFTTNYDLAIECLSEIDSLSYDIEYGMEKSGTRSILNIKRFEKISNINSRPLIHLLKLHGSINWWRDAETGLIEIVNPRHQTSTGYQELMIYPTREKTTQINEQPYQFFYNKLKDYLSSNKLRICIVIGYSFRDDQINEFFKLSLNNGLRLLVFDANKSSIARQLKEVFGETKFRVEEMKFGMWDSNNQGRLNSIIEDELNKLPTTLRSGY